MLNIFSLIAATDKDAAEVAEAAFERFSGIINIILPILMSVLLVLGMFYGIILGVKYAKAEEDEDKKKARGALINVIVGVLIAIIFVAVVQIILNQNFVARLFKPVTGGSGVSN